MAVFLFFIIPTIEEIKLNGQAGLQIFERIISFLPHQVLK